MAVENPDDANEPGQAADASSAAPASAFVGEGQTLSGAPSASTGPAPAVQADAASVEVDASKPKTKVQIRFHDGSRRAQEFNQDHTVGDLISFCSQCIGGQSVGLMGGFPPAELTDNAQTLKDAGLCGAQVTVKLK